MWLTAATIACTKVRTVQPGFAPPTSLAMRTIASTIRSIPRRADSEATPNSPRWPPRPPHRPPPGAGPDRAMLTSLEVPRWLGSDVGVVTLILPCSRGTSRRWSTLIPQPDRWIQAEGLEFYGHNRPSRVLEKSLVGVGTSRGGEVRRRAGWSRVVRQDGTAAHQRPNPRSLRMSKGR